MKSIIRLILTLSVTVQFYACQTDFLAIKPDKALVVPRTLDDLQALLDNADVMNARTPGLSEIGTDDMEVSYAHWQTMPPLQANAYVWGEELYQSPQLEDWTNPYKQVFYANVVLDALGSLAATAGNSATRKEVQGSALFFRAHAFLQLAQLFAPGYAKETAGVDLGIPLKLDASVQDWIGRSTVEDTYRRIIEDLSSAADALPPVAKLKTRPSAVAAHALLARTYLQMGLYKEAHQHARSALAISDVLLDFNTLDGSLAVPIPRFAQDVIFHSTAIGYSMLIPPICRISPDLRRRFSTGDLRREIFFATQPDGSMTYRLGNYSGVAGYFSGISTSELYLIAAECLSRDGRIGEATAVLGTLLLHRYRREDVPDLSQSTGEELLGIVLEERRKELVFRCMRWGDLKRLNSEGSFAVTLERSIGGTSYRLLPNDPRYAYPIPPGEMELNPMPQNIR